MEIVIALLIGMVLGASVAAAWLRQAHAAHSAATTTELPVDTRNGLDHQCVVSLDDIQTIPVARLAFDLG